MVEFDEKKHQYKVDGHPVISVTQLMKKHGLAPDYSGIDPGVLSRAAERGTMIHKEIEEYCKTGSLGFTAEVEAFAEAIKERKLKVTGSEEVVYNDVVAGTVDLILETDDGGQIIADVKTTSVVHYDAVAWQLSIYNYLMGNANDKAWVFHFNVDGELRVIEIPFKPYDEVERLIGCEIAGLIYSQNVERFMSEEQIAAIEQAERIIEQAEAQKKAAEDIMSKIKAAALEEMKKRGLKTFETDRVKITYVMPSERTSIDTTRLKKERPDIAAEFSKTSQIAASVRITVK